MWAVINSLCFGNVCKTGNGVRQFVLGWGLMGRRIRLKTESQWWYQWLTRRVERLLLGLELDKKPSKKENTLMLRWQLSRTLLCFLFCATIVFAQQISGSISGSVKDSQLASI